MGRKLGRKRRKVTLAEAPLTTDRRGPVDRRAAELPRQAKLVAVEVDDPYEAGATIIAFKNEKSDPLERLKVQGDIDEAQYQAGKAYERDLEMVEVGNVKAIDPSKEAVDGGRFGDSVTEGYGKAHRRLEEAGVILGQFKEALVRGVLIGNVSPRQMAIANGYKAERELWYYGRQFRNALEELAQMYGYVVRI